ncbi:MAG: hypothetical protein E6Q50_16530 [Lysobacter sp.]|nr:MAG: hypothetical protein E6Q50_16530 [Lysobacter sp.]
MAQKKYSNLSKFEKIGVWGSIASLIGIAIAFFPSNESPTITKQVATGDNSTQIGTVYGDVTFSDDKTFEKIEKYKAAVSLVDENPTSFREFLERNAGKKVTIESELILDYAVPIHFLAHQACDFQGPLETGELGETKTFSFGIPEFSTDLDEKMLQRISYNESRDDYDVPEVVLSKVRCLDRIRIEPINPAKFRWSYGGTGMRSLPLHGNFRITRRFYSGPSVEYTLTQIEE